MNFWTCLEFRNAETGVQILNQQCLAVLMVLEGFGGLRGGLGIILGVSGFGHNNQEDIPPNRHCYQTTSQEHIQYMSRPSYYK